MQQIDPARKSRMTLGAVTKGRVKSPLRVVLYGTEGVGKSTFASDAPSPIFLPFSLEDGSAHLDTARFPCARSWGDVVDALRVLTEETHDYKTLVIDTLDSLEPIVWERVTATRSSDSGKKVTSIEEYGFAKGYIYAVDVWRDLLAKLDGLRLRGMNVILIAHASLVTIKSPDTEDFQRFDLKLHHKSSALLREWSDHVLFATTEAATKKINNRTKVVGLGDRVLHTTSAPGWVAKTRSGAPATLPLAWESFVDAVEGKNESADELIARITEALERMPEAKRAVASRAVADAGSDVDALRKIENRINVTIAQEKHS